MLKLQHTRKTFMPSDESDVMCIKLLINVFVCQDYISGHI